MGGNRNHTVSYQYYCTASMASITSSNRHVFHMHHRFQKLPYFMHSNTHFRKENWNPTKETETQITWPTQFSTTKCYSSLLGQSLCTELPRMIPCSKWPVKEQSKQNQRGGKTWRQRVFLWTLAISLCLFCKMGVSLLSSQKKTRATKNTQKGQYERCGVNLQYLTQM